MDPPGCVSLTSPLFASHRSKTEITALRMGRQIHRGRDWESVRGMAPPQGFRERVESLTAGGIHGTGFPLNAFLCFWGRAVGAGGNALSRV